NKVLYFFRTKVKVYETIRAHIVQELHGFRLLKDLLTRDPTIRDRTSPTVSDNLHWVNVYSLMDPVSGRLVFYNNMLESRYLFSRHMSYWHDPKLYREVLTALQAKSPDASLTTT